ncbi:MAG: gas vesicle protein [Dehalococcoidia bacterium]
MEPTRDTHVTLVDLLDRILDKGLVLYADIIVSVAGIPLIGVNLRAALAGMETMLAYGVMRDWDQRVRAWEGTDRRGKELSLIAGEQLVLKMFGSHFYSQGIYAAWRHGYFYLTDKRLVLYLPSFNEVLFETPLEKIRGLATGREKHFTGEEREHLCLLLEGGDIAWLHALDTGQLKEAIEKGLLALGITWEEMPALAMRDEKAAKLLTDSERITCAGKMWYLMGSSSPSGIMSETWQSGHLYITDRRLCWWHDFEEKAAFEIPLERVTAATVEVKDLGPALRQRGVFDIIYQTEDGKRVASFSGERLSEWQSALSQIIAGQGASLEEETTDACPQCGAEASVGELLQRGCDVCGWVSPRLRKEILVAPEISH